MRIEYLGLNPKWVEARGPPESGSILDEGLEEQRRQVSPSLFLPYCSPNTVATPPASAPAAVAHSSLFGKEFLSQPSCAQLAVVEATPLRRF